MKKRRSLLLAISGLLATVCGQLHAVKDFTKKKQVHFLLYEGQKYEIPAHKKIVFIDLPPNKYFEVEAIKLDDRSVHSTRNYLFRMPCIPTKPVYFELKENNLVFIIYPKGTPWPDNQLKTT